MAILFIFAGCFPDFLASYQHLKPAYVCQEQLDAAQHSSMLIPEILSFFLTSIVCKNFKK